MCSNLRRLLASLIICFALLPGSLWAKPEEPITREQADGLVAGLKFQTGVITLEKDLATLTVPASMRFLDGADANTVLVKLWGNPPGQNPLGLLMPEGTSPLSSDAWVVVITYEAGGYVKDEDAKKINYDQLLTEMKKDTESVSTERQKQGYPAIHLIGWARTPHYDQATHKLYWAKELQFGGEDWHTLNYNIRMLGRRGVLVLNSVASMAQLPAIENATPQILAAIDFKAGSRYTDFNPGSDKVATYGISALIAGGVAAKLGLFKGIWVAILALKKFVIIGVAALAAWFRKIFGGKHKTAREISQETPPSQVE
jgi:uncharacterized membrane-anchored protein